MWQWCPGARGDCRVCRRWVIGLWKHWVDQTTADVAVCAHCAGGADGG